MNDTAKKPRPSRNDRKVAKDRKSSELSVKAQIAARVAPAPKVNPNEPKPRKHPYAEGTPGFNRAKHGFTLTQIKRSINEPNSNVTVALDEHGNSTGEIVSVELVKPTAAQKRLRREQFVARGLLGPFAANSERRKTHRRNGHYATANVKDKKPKKTWHRSKSAAPVEAPKKAAKK
jgi:hypothetical protein